MSGIAPIYRPAGQTQALSVVATSHAAVSLTVAGGDSANYVALLNTGAVVVAVKLGTAGAAAVLPVDGTPGDFALPAAMQQAILVPMPTAQGGTACQITAIGATAGPSLVYATPVVLQS